MVNLKRKLRSTYRIIEATDRHEASRGLSATARLLVSAASPAVRNSLFSKTVSNVVLVPSYVEISIFFAISQWLGLRPRHLKKRHIHVGAPIWKFTCHGPCQQAQCASTDKCTVRVKFLHWRSRQLCVQASCSLTKLLVISATSQRCPSQFPHQYVVCVRLYRPYTKTFRALRTAVCGIRFAQWHRARRR